MFKIPLFLCGLLLAQQAFAANSPSIEKMMQTPASAFDVFLFRLYESAKCNKVVKNNNIDEADLCLTSLQYDSDENILSAYFRIFPGAEAMDDFVEQDAAGRKTTLLKVLDNTLRRFGVLDSWGLLHNTPMSHGGSVGKAEEKSFRADIAQITRVILRTSYDGVVYIATRHPDGGIDYIPRE